MSPVLRAEEHRCTCGKRIWAWWVTDTVTDQRLRSRPSYLKHEGGSCPFKGDGA